jgi:hypothetical protein
MAYISKYFFNSTKKKSVLDFETQQLETSTNTSQTRSHHKLALITNPQQSEKYVFINYFFHDH